MPKVMKLSSLYPTIVLSLLPTYLRGAGEDEEVVLIVEKGVTSKFSAKKISYQCTFRNLWIKERHPINYPEQDALWIGPLMWTTTSNYAPWKAMEPATTGAEIFVETGFTDVLLAEVEIEQERMDALGWTENQAGGFFVSQENFVQLPPLEANGENSFLTVMAGISPSPGWFSGVYHFRLIDEITRTWYNHIKFQTYAWDAGSDAGTTYASAAADLTPNLPVEKFTTSNAPPGGELKGPNGVDLPVVAEIECFLVLGDEPMELPSCDWFANPCCNETNTMRCNNKLPWEATPEFSAEYQEVLEKHVLTEGGSGMSVADVLGTSSSQGSGIDNVEYVIDENPGSENAPDITSSDPCSLDFTLDCANITATTFTAGSSGNEDTAGTDGAIPVDAEEPDPGSGASMVYEDLFPAIVNGMCLLGVLPHLF